jgi:hypothetical protein
VRDVDHLFLITGTGIATPSIDARLVNRLGMRPDVLRTPWPAPPTTCAPIQELAHAGRKAGFGMLPALAKPAIEDFNYGVGADAGDRGHVEHTPDLSAPAPYTAALAQAAAAVAINSASSGGPALPASIASQEQRCDQKIGKSSGSAHWREAHSKGLSWSGRNLLAAIAT